MKKATLAIAMLTLLSFGAAQAQTHFSLRLGGAFPMGKFADASANYSTGNLNWGLFDNSKKESPWAATTRPPTPAAKATTSSSLSTSCTPPSTATSTTTLKNR